MDELNTPIPMNRLLSVGLPWLCEKILEHSAYPSLHTPDGEPFDFRYWVWWSVEHGFVYLWPDPPTLGLIARPVNRDMVYNWHTYPQDQLLYLYDDKGDGLWMDFLWAPGQYNIVMKFLRMTGKKWGGWEHRVTQKPHIRRLDRLFSHSF